MTLGIAGYAINSATKRTDKKVRKALVILILVQVRRVTYFLRIALTNNNCFFCSLPFIIFMPFMVKVSFLI